MNENQTLELQMKANAQQAITSIDKLLKSLGLMQNSVSKVTTTVNKNGESTVKSLTSIEKQGNKIYKTFQKMDKDGNLKSVSTSMSTLKNNTDKAVNSVSKLGKSLALGGLYLGTKRLTTQLLGWMNDAVDQTEQLNLFNVVFNNIEKNGTTMYSNLGKEATKFQHKLNESFGTNKTQTFYMQGIFQSMGENVGISDYHSAIMSETMTKLTYDLASLYNKTETATAEAIRAGVYAGQTKPLRSYGIDVTQTSMQPILEQLGITDRSVKQMSQAEKEILRYLATLEQAKVAMGDLANTIESPSNQMKIFRQQLTETKVAVSSLFMGVFSNVLPYANAFLMVIKEVSEAIADMFGIKLSDFNSGIASSEDAYLDLEDSIDGATGAVKELKRQTLGFDQIHNINENNDSGSGTSISGGIDQRLLDAIKGYDNGMNNVRMKATEIRDKIMEWLGFTKEIDPITGEVNFKYQGITTTLKNMWTNFKNLNTQGKIFIGLGIYLIFKKMFDNAKKLTTVLGGTGLLGSVKSLFSPMKNLYTSLDNVNYANKTLNQGLSEGVSNWSKSLSGMDKFKVGLVGIIGLSTGMSGMANAMKSISTEGLNLSNSLQAVISGLSGIASGAYIGSIFGPWGTVIGGATGALLEFISALSGYQTETDKIITKSQELRNEVDNYLTSLEEQNIAIEQSLVSNLALTNSHEKLIRELETLVDENGNVKQGYEERANYILTVLSQAYGKEYELINGQIQNYQNLTTSIQDSIKVKQAEILLNANEEKFAKALQNEVQLWKEKEKAQSKLNDLLEEEKRLQNIINKIVPNGNFRKMKVDDLALYNQTIESLEGVQKEIGEWETTLNNATLRYTENINTQTRYSDLQEAVLNGNIEEIEQKTKEFTNSYVSENKVITLTMEERIKKDLETKQIMLENAKDLSVEKKAIVENSANSTLQTTLNELTGMTKNVKSLTPDIINSWKYIAENSTNEFLIEFNKIPTELQQNVVDKMQEKGLRISQELQNGLNKINPTITVRADTSGASTSLDNLFGKFSYIMNNMKNNAFLAINSVIGKANGGVYSNGSWHDIKQYANGGSPSHGTMFVAGESGAEIVGHINGKTEVLNQSQIASAIYNAVLSAMSQVGSSSSKVDVDVRVHSDSSVVVDDINQTTKQTGVCPIFIPVP